jgi:transcriptional repressor NrdR
MVVKKDGAAEPFDRGKLMRGLMVATAKRGVSVEQLDALISDIETDLHNSFKYEVGSSQVGDMVLIRLRDLDKVAYVRFASVYKEFQDLDEFTSELKALGRRG